jgi:hypothetical protein
VHLQGQPPFYELHERLLALFRGNSRNTNLVSKCATGVTGIIEIHTSDANYKDIIHNIRNQEDAIVPQSLCHRSSFASILGSTLP